MLPRWSSLLLTVDCNGHVDRFLSFATLYFTKLVCRRVYITNNECFLLRYGYRLAVRITKPAVSHTYSQYVKREIAAEHQHG